MLLTIIDARIISIHIEKFHRGESPKMFTYCKPKSDYCYGSNLFHKFALQSKFIGIIKDFF